MTPHRPKNDDTTEFTVDEQPTQAIDFSQKPDDAPADIELNDELEEDNKVGPTVPDATTTSTDVQDAESPSPTGQLPALPAKIPETPPGWVSPAQLQLNKATLIALNAHVEGDGRYDHCNAAEDHAIKNPGHSLTVIFDLYGSADLRPILRITCHGTPRNFEEGNRDCFWFDEMLP